MMIRSINLLQRFSTVIRSPIDLSLFKTDQGINRLKNSSSARFKDQTIIDNIVLSLNKHRTTLHQLEMTNKQTNHLNQQLKTFFQKNPQSPQISHLKAKQQILKNTKSNLQKQLNSLKSKLQFQLKHLGNIVHQDVPVSKDQDYNKVLKTYNTKNMEKYEGNSYDQLCSKLKLVDLKRGQKVGGHRGYFLQGNGVKLALGLAQYGIDFLEKKGYELYQVPTIVQQNILKDACQLQTMKDMYKIQGQQSYLIATSQQSLAGLYQGQSIGSNSLPIRMAGYSNCYRKQAGAHGKDIQGIFRVHQFQKVEQFTICKPQQSQRQMDLMLKVCQQFYQSLQIPYRVVDIVSGQLNDAATRKYDLQGWYPSQNKYRELVSISNCTSYQSRLLQITYLQNNQRVYPHMLNGTLIAIQRAITCFIQNNYVEGKLSIPKSVDNYVHIN